MESDFYSNSSSVSSGNEFIPEKRDKGRSKTSLRMIYEAQVSVIQKQIGDLEKVRTDLGLSQRKMCQLLMVDPSAWTRWTRQEQPAPPHIWRALQWYKALQEKIPGLTPQYFVGKDPQVLHAKAMREMDDVRMDFSDKYLKLHEEVKRELKFHRNLNYVMSALMLIMTIFFIVGCLR